MRTTCSEKRFSPLLALRIAAAIAAVAYLLFFRSSARPPVDVLPRTFHFLSMGTVASATFHGDSDATAGAEIVRGAFGEVEANLSVFSPTSMISRLNVGGAITVPDAGVHPTGFDFAFVLDSALGIARDTDGAFDPTVNPLMRLWGFRGGGARMPPDAAVSEALAKTGWRSVLREAGGNGVTFSFAAPGMELDLGGMAKGYAVDLAFERLRAAGFRDFLINLGGNIRVSGNPEPGRDSWHVAVRDPDDPSKTTGEAIALTNGQAVATSGSYARFVEIDGRRYSHIIDPRTGHPVEPGGSVSVVAPSAMLADGYSTAYFVMGRRGVERLPVRR